jgi:hypothetical protein
MMSNSEEARLIAFNRYREGLLAILEKACKRGRKTKSFEKDKAWRHLRFMALAYLYKEERVKQKRKMAPVANRVKLLRQLGSALGKARHKIEEAVGHDVRGVLYLAWCGAYGDDPPDLTDPIISVAEDEFEEMVVGMVARLNTLETAAFCAAEQENPRSGRPGGTSTLPYDFIGRLEFVYRDITGKPGGRGPGPFARFIKNFLEALGHEMTEQSVIDAIKDAKKRG